MWLSQLLFDYACFMRSCCSHCNDEVAAHVNTINYLCKYVSKAPDSDSLVIDEIGTSSQQHSLQVRIVITVTACKNVA